jgi:hypothetical protein
MKKKSLLRTLRISLIYVFFISLHALGQGSYFSFSGGYGIKMGSQNILTPPSVLAQDEDFPSTFTNDVYGASNLTSEQINLSLGSGLNFGLNFGHMLTPNFGFDLGVNYLLGSPTKAVTTSGTFAFEQSIQASMLRLLPGIVVLGNGNYYQRTIPYAKLGCAIGFGSLNYQVTEPVSKLDMEVVYDGGSPFGLFAGFGFSHKISDRISLVGEINTFNLTYSPKGGEVTKLKAEDIDFLPSLDVSEREIEFVDTFSDLPQSPTQPLRALSRRFPMGSVGVNLGIKICLGNQF